MFYRLTFLAVSQSCGKFPKNDVQHIVAVTALTFPAHTPDASDTPRRGCARSRGSTSRVGDLGRRGGRGSGKLNTTKRWRVTPATHLQPRARRSVRLQHPEAAAVKRIFITRTARRHAPMLWQSSHPNNSSSTSSSCNPNSTAVLGRAYTLHMSAISPWECLAVLTFE